MRRPVILFAHFQTTVSFVVLMLFATISNAAPPQYRIEAFGLSDTEHTRVPDNYRFGSVIRPATGANLYFGGRNDRYNGEGYRRGQSAWFSDGTTVDQIGFYDAYHTDTYGTKNSFILDVADNGLVVGESWGYNGNINGGAYSTIWTYVGGTILNIGLTDYTHTYNHNSAGLHASDVLDVNSAGQILGTSTRFTLSSGKTPWLHTNGNTQIVGLIGSQYDNGLGVSTAEALYLNAAGAVVGKATKYDGSGGFNGNVVWLTSDGSTQVVGPQGAEFVDSNGKQIDLLGGLNDAGQVAGSSRIWADDDSSAGNAAWLYTGSSVVLIGQLTGSEFTSSVGVRSSSAVLINNSGQVVGIAERYADGDSFNGRSTWLYAGTAMVEIGLADVEHTRGSDGYQYNYPELQNDAGDVVGTSARYHPTLFGDRGQSAWLYNGTTTINVGLVGGVYQQAGSYNSTKFAEALGINNAGQVIGKSLRYAGGAVSGETAWLFDGVTTVALDAPSQRSDGYTYSKAISLGEDGTVLGYYKYFDESDIELGIRPFIYTAAGELYDLGDLVAVGMDSWSHLISGAVINENGVIFATGVLNDAAGSQSAAVLYPVAVIDTEIDVDPSSSENEIDPDSIGQISVAVKTTSTAAGDSVDFDATQVDPATVRFGPGGAVSATPPLTGDVDADSDADVTFAFDIVSSGILCDDTEVTLNGETYAGDVVVGSDTITTVNCEEAGCHP
jgi:hypothetical protein